MRPHATVPVHSDANTLQSHSDPLDIADGEVAPAPSSPATSPKRARDAEAVPEATAAQDADLESPTKKEKADDSAVATVEVVVANEVAADKQEQAEVEPTELVPA